MRGTCESKACGDDETGAALVVADGSVPAGGLQRDSDLGSAGEMKGPFEEDFDEMPPKERPSQYDFLRDSIDGTVDKVNCGGDKDKAKVDAVDKVSKNCEVVKVKKG